MSLLAGSGYLERVRSALADARADGPDPVWGRAVTVYGATLLYSLGWFFAGPIDVSPSFQEGGPIDWLSSVYLSGAAMFAWAAWMIGSRSTRGSWVWLVCAVGFLYLAVDERFQFHEHAGNAPYRAFLDERPLGMRKWNDLTVFLYGLVGSVFVLLVLPTFVRYRNVRLFLALGIVFYSLHSVTDTIGGAFHEGWIKEPLEETFKILTGASFVLGFQQAFLARSTPDRTVPK